MENEILQESMKMEDDYLLQKKFEIMVEMNNKKIANEFNKITEAINKLNREMSDIKKYLSESRLVRTEPISKETKNNEQVAPKEIKSNEQPPRSRTGNIRPGDERVDATLNKLFYFDNKK